jgi:hypothetical protein
MNLVKPALVSWIISMAPNMILSESRRHFQAIQ